MHARQMLYVVMVCCITLFTPISFSSQPINSIVIFGDSLSDNGNTTHLLKSLRKEQSPSYLVRPFRIYIDDLINGYSKSSSLPQYVFDTAKKVVDDFFNQDLGPIIATLVGKVNHVPLLPQNPYWNYHFSNGMVWNEYLAKIFNLDTTNPSQYINQAFGGSWAVTYDKEFTLWNIISYPVAMLTDLVNGKLIPPSLGLVTETYLMVEKKANPDALYVLFSGGNDYLNALSFRDNYDEKIMSEYINNVISGIESSMARLVHAGAKQMLIFGVPDIGSVPVFNRSPVRQLLSRASKRHNKRLQRKVQEWKKRYPQVRYTYIDIDAMLTEVINNPGKYGLSNVTEPCIDIKITDMLHANGLMRIKGPFDNNRVLKMAQLVAHKDKRFLFGAPNYHLCTNPSEYLFWDEVHPTTAVHKQLAKQLCSLLEGENYAVNCA